MCGAKVRFFLDSASFFSLTTVTFVNSITDFVNFKTPPDEKCRFSSREVPFLQKGLFVHLQNPVFFRTIRLKNERRVAELLSISLPSLLLERVHRACSARCRVRRAFPMVLSLRPHADALASSALNYRYYHHFSITLRLCVHISTKQAVFPSITICKHRFLLVSQIISGSICR